MRPINIPQVFFIDPFETVTMGRYTVTALPANHDRAIECLNYIISDGSNTILWLHDTGIPLPRTWDYLKEHKLKFDLVSMDCSFPHGTNANAEHMDMKQCREQVEILQHIGCMKETTLVFLSHIGHKCQRYTCGLGAGGIAVSNAYCVRWSPSIRVISGRLFQQGEL